jgi:hypothetical protein
MVRKLTRASSLTKRAKYLAWLVENLNRAKPRQTRVEQPWVFHPALSLTKTESNLSTEKTKKRSNSARLGPNALKFEWSLFYSVSIFSKFSNMFPDPAPTSSPVWAEQSRTRAGWLPSWSHRQRLRQRPIKPQATKQTRKLRTVSNFKPKHRSPHQLSSNPLLDRPSTAPWPPPPQLPTIPASAISPAHRTRTTTRPRSRASRTYAMLVYFISLSRRECHD